MILIFNPHPNPSPSPPYLRIIGVVHNPPLSPRSEPTTETLIRKSSQIRSAMAKTNQGGGGDGPVPESMTTSDKSGADESRSPSPKRVKLTEAATPMDEDVSVPLDKSSSDDIVMEETATQGGVMTSIDELKTKLQEVKRENDLCQEALVGVSSVSGADCYVGRRLVPINIAFQWKQNMSEVKDSTTYMLRKVVCKQHGGIPKDMVEHFRFLENVYIFDMDFEKYTSDLHRQKLNLYEFDTEKASENIFREMELDVVEFANNARDEVDRFMERLVDKYAWDNAFVTVLFLLSDQYRAQIEVVMRRWNNLIRDYKMRYFGLLKSEIK